MQILEKLSFIREGCRLSTQFVCGNQGIQNKQPILYTLTEKHVAYSELQGTFCSKLLDIHARVAFIPTAGGQES